MNVTTTTRSKLDYEMKDEHETSRSKSSQKTKLLLWSNSSAFLNLKKNPSKDITISPTIELNKSSSEYEA